MVWAVAVRSAILPSARDNVKYCIQASSNSGRKYADDDDDDDDCMSTKCVRNKSAKFTLCQVY